MLHPTAFNAHILIIHILFTYMLKTFISPQPLCEDEGRSAGGAEAAGGQDPARRGAAEGAERESGTGPRNRHGNVDGIRTILKNTTNNRKHACHFD